MSENLKERIYQKILNFIAHQARTQKEIEDRIKRYLYKYEIPAAEKELVVTNLVNDLTEQGFINDEKYAQDFSAAIALSSKPRGKQYVKRFLLKKGIAQSIIEAVLQDTDDEAEYKGAYELAVKKLKSLRYKNTQDLKNKLWRFLAYRGYASNVIGHVIDSIVAVE